MSAVKYTDRDVRSNPDFMDLALDYLENYEGEFEFLIDCKMRVSSGIELSIGMIRGILNCMRVDPRAPEMPDPRPSEEMGEVIEMRHKRRVPTKRKKIPCPLYEAKLEHTHKRKDRAWYETYEQCQGYHRINRTVFYLDAKIKTPFIAARGGKMIHKAEGSGYVQWFPNSHSWGFDEYIRPILYGKGVCKFSGKIKRPILLAAADCADFSFQDGSPVPLCPHCFPQEG